LNFQLQNKRIQKKTNQHTLLSIQGNGIKHLLLIDD
jgi:hypothetical protein